MEIYDIPVATLAGEPGDLSALRGKVSLVVNVASRCGLTPQYAGLERLQEKYGADGFTVVGFPCNQFAGQEPGTSEEIATFCSTTYGVSFPLYEKVEAMTGRRGAEILYLDDRPENIATGRELGWQAHVHSDPAITIAAVRAAGMLG